MHDRLTLERVLTGLKDLKDGNFHRRLVPGGDGMSTEIAAVFNELADRNQRLVGELMRVRAAAGCEGAMEERLTLGGMPGGWSAAVNSVNGMIDDLVRPVTELSRVLAAVAEGDLARRMPPKAGATGGRQDFDSLSGTVNGLLDRLSMAAERRSEFLATMSHELRTPLSGVLVLAKVLADDIDGNLTPNQVELAKTIYSSGHDLLQLINDVLDLAKVEAGHMEIQAEDVEITELAGHVESRYRPLAAEKGLDFAVVLSSGLPASLKTDKHRLQQILRNLLSNAVKFTDQGGVRLNIRRADGAEPAGQPLPAAPGVLAFCVEDTGIGIPAGKLALVFEAFRQADGTTSRKYGGTGLGLSISRELTRLLGGELQVDSRPGRGSTFTLYLPVDALPATDVPLVSGRPAPEAPGGTVMPSS